MHTYAYSCFYAYSLPCVFILCIIISMHIHCHAYSLPCIFISMHIHFYAYSFLCIFISMHIHYHAYSFTYIFISLYIFISMHIHTPTSLYLYKLQPKPYTWRDTQTEIHRQGTDSHRQIYTAIQLYRYVYRRYQSTEYRLYLTTDYLVDSTINSMIVESFVDVTSHITK